jgi:acyl carrier protein
MRDTIRSFILDQFPSARRKNLQDADRLIESGIIDSLGILDIVAFVESEFGIRVDDDDMTAENFHSIDELTAFVERKRGAAAVG